MHMSSFLAGMIMSHDHHNTHVTLPVMPCARSRHSQQQQQPAAQQLLHHSSSCSRRSSSSSSRSQPQQQVRSSHSAGTEKLTSCCRTHDPLPDQGELQHEKKFSLRDEAAFSDCLRKFHDKDSISLISMVVPTWLAIWHRGRLSKLSRRASG